MSPALLTTGDALADRGEAALACEELSSAIAFFDQAEPQVHDPDRCAGGRWMAHMLRGDFAAAWRESDAIRGRGAPDPHRFWNGKSWAGQRLILRSLHGFGDAVQMFRFLPRLQASVSELIVEVPPRLVELAPYFKGMGQVITWGHDAPATPPVWDLQMEIMELPYALRISDEDLQAQQDYLEVPRSEFDRVSSMLGVRKKPRVGLVWCAGSWNPSRSIPFAIFRGLLEINAVEFWSLQGDPERAAWLSSGSQQVSQDVYTVGPNILSLAALVQQLDLVVTVDTLAAHLAGALNVPCWLLLQHRADWRWMSRKDRTPWYPSMELLRQAEPGDWASLISLVRKKLESFATTTHEVGLESKNGALASLGPF